MASEIRLIASDLDGTLLTDIKEVSPRTMKALRDAYQKGVEILVSTGRPLNAVPPLLLEMEEIRYYMVSNGAAIYDKKEDTYVYHACMTKEQVFDILARVDDLLIWKEVCVNGTSHAQKELFNRLDEILPVGGSADYLFRTRVPEDDMNAFLAGQSGGFEKVNLFFGSREMGDVLRARFRDEPDFYITSAMWNNLEISDKAAEKGEALAFLAGKLGIPIESTMAFGDNLNDLELIVRAGIGVAMGNAEDTLKEAADIVTASNLEEGVAIQIERLVL